MKIFDLLGNIVFEQYAENTNQLNISTSFLSSDLFSITINNTSFKKPEVIR